MRSILLVTILLITLIGNSFAKSCAKGVSKLGCPGLSQTAVAPPALQTTPRTLASPKPGTIAGQTNHQTTRRP